MRQRGDATGLRQFLFSPERRGSGIAAAVDALRAACRDFSAADCLWRIAAHCLCSRTSSRDYDAREHFEAFVSWRRRIGAHRAPR